MKTFIEIRNNTYYDSVTLMLITKELKKMTEVNEVIVGMGTELNKELCQNLNLSHEKISTLTSNDFFIVASSSIDDVMIKIIEKVDELLNSSKSSRDSNVKVTSINSAIDKLPNANLAMISVPGQYAYSEAKKALDKGLHVMLFSDNVTVEEEIELKSIGKEKGLLVMGPDCGTAIINGVPLCFANVVRRGDIGVIGASGTGTQEVTVIIDRLGKGVSQVIGTGGRDLNIKVGGIMMMEAFKVLSDDPRTKVIVLISKPPAPEVAEKILSMVKTSTKPVVVNFIGGDKELIEKFGAYACISLEDTAHKAVALLEGKTPSDFVGFSLSANEVTKKVDMEVSKFSSGQKYIRALYTGGTIADEAMKLLEKDGYRVYSNIPLSREFMLKDINKSQENTCIDLGDDIFTRGRPHPMIDPIGRIERLAIESMDDEIAIVLMDFMLGYGSHVDPAGEMLLHIIEAKRNMESRGKYLCVVGYICGTPNDPQNFEAQKEKLENAGVVLMPSNAQAVRFASMILSKINNKPK